MAEWHIKKLKMLCAYKKSQVSMEFMILAGISIFVLTIILGIVANESYNINKEKSEMAGEDLVAKAQKEITLASRVSDGYYREFSLPYRLGNKEYSIRISENRVIISTKQQDFWRTIPSAEGTFMKGNNTINKTNGIIYLN